MRVNEVIAPVTVLDRSGEMVFDLTQKDFRVFDNGAEQKIEHFDLGGEPLSVVLAVETSSRIEPLLPAVRQTGIVFSQTVMARTAEAAVIGFDDAVDVLEPFTTDPDRVQNAIEQLRMGTSGTLLYDAMARGVSLLDERPPARRRILVVLAEAQDTGSESKLGEVLRQAQLANVTIYSIGLSTTAAALRSKPNPAPPSADRAARHISGAHAERHAANARNRAGNAAEHGSARARGVAGEDRDERARAQFTGGCEQSDRRLACEHDERPLDRESHG